MEKVWVRNGEVQERLEAGDDRTNLGSQSSILESISLQVPLNQRANPPTTKQLGSSFSNQSSPIKDPSISCL